MVLGILGSGFRAVEVAQGLLGEGILDGLTQKTGGGALRSFHRTIHFEEYMDIESRRGMTTEVKLEALVGVEPRHSLAPEPHFTATDGCSVT
jgi:hypothetical protein